MIEITEVDRDWIGSRDWLRVGTGWCNGNGLADGGGKLYGITSKGVSLFNLFWINGSRQKRLTAEDAENRRRRGESQRVVIFLCVPLRTLRFSRSSRK